LDSSPNIPELLSRRLVKLGSNQFVLGYLLDAAHTVRAERKLGLGDPEKEQESSTIVIHCQSVKASLLVTAMC
jgi:hypothetical protein